MRFRCILVHIKKFKSAKKDHLGVKMAFFCVLSLLAANDQYFFGKWINQKNNDRFCTVAI